MKHRPTDAEFEELKRKRDVAVAASIKALCEEYGWDPGATRAHISHSKGCYCACPEGPCQHIWNGPNYISEDECMSSVTCSLCGLPAIYHDMRCGP